jgi:hypothetical protein
MDAHAKNLSQFSANLRTVSIALHKYAQEIEQRALLMDGYANRIQELMAVIAPMDDSIEPVQDIAPRDTTRFC